MIVAKFGGTAMAPQNFCCLKTLAANCGCVTVSAVGREYYSDKKATDLLLAHLNGDNSAWHAFESKFRRLVEVNSVNVDVEKLLYSAKERSLKYGLAYCLSLGEELTAKIAAAYLGREYIEAEQCVRFCGNKLQLARTLANLRSAFGGAGGVMGGFYGGCADGGRQVFPRGGGDISGALAAAATNAVYENWTDVDGVCKANPKRVVGAETVKNLSYSEMYALARGGAEVLHPDAVKIAQKYGVIICVGNYLKGKTCTMVGNCPSGELFLSVTERQSRCGVISTVLHGMPLDVVARCIAEVANKLQSGKYDFGGISRCKIFPDRVELCTAESILPLLYVVFRNANNC